MCADDAAEEEKQLQFVPYPCTPSTHARVLKILPYGFLKADVIGIASNQNTMCY